MTERVQIPVYTDRWMMGDRYGEVIKEHLPKGRGPIMLSVKLDKSGKVVHVIADDCERIT